MARTPLETVVSIALSELAASDSSLIRASRMYPERIATSRRMKTDDHTEKDIAEDLGVNRVTLCCLCA